MEKKEGEKEIPYTTRHNIQGVLNELFIFGNNTSIGIRLVKGTFTNPNHSSFTPKKTQGIYIEERVRDIYTVRFKLADLKQIEVAKNGILFGISRGEHVIKKPKILELLDPEEIVVFNMQTSDNLDDPDKIRYHFAKDLTTEEYYDKKSTLRDTY